jgi:hypothetical protein
MNKGGTMKKSYFLLFIFYCLLFTVLGCGGDGPGSPGSDGSEKTGVKLDGIISPTYQDEPVYSVDAFRNLDCDNDPTTDDAEYYADHTAILTIYASLINPNTDFQPGKLFIEKYTIKYYRSPDSINAPPILTDTRFATISIDPPIGANINVVETTVVFVDLIRKIQYVDDIFSGIYTSNILNNYTAVYKFEGKNEFGTKFSFEVQRDFQIGDFDNCGG